MSTDLFTLNELLERSGLDQGRTLVVRHRPHEAALRKVFPFIVAEHRDLFLAYQRSQWRALESAMTRADNLLAFVGLEPGRAVFAGAYRISAHRSISQAEFWAIPENQRLKAYGMTGMDGDRHRTLLFDLDDLDLFSGHFGKLVISWPGLERSWWRWAVRNTFPVAAINDVSRFEVEMPSWDELVVNWAELKTMPASWRHRLSQWRGIYLITDLARKASYVGSAYGTDNILGRWLTYADTGHGGNKQLRLSQPQDLRFSVLELTSPTLEAAAVIRLESAWKDRLLTRQIGLNEN